MPRLKAFAILSVSVAHLLLLAIVFFHKPVLGLSIVLVIAGLTGLTEFRRRRRLAQLAATREGESLCTFARSFDDRAIDTWVIRAVFEELRPYCKFGKRTLPLRANDHLANDLFIDSDDLVETMFDIEARTGRWLDDQQLVASPPKIQTVRDLVMFFTTRPLREGAINRVGKTTPPAPGV
jgi:acyl carrier protein